MKEEFSKEMPDIVIPLLLSCLDLVYQPSICYCFQPRVIYPLDPTYARIIPFPVDSDDK